MWFPCWYTETLACSANANTSTHAATSRRRQQAGLKVFAGEVKGGITTVDYTCEYRFGKWTAGSIQLGIWGSKSGTGELLAIRKSTILLSQLTQAHFLANWPN